ncbi:MAG: hypothetical protein SX243_05830 [Acidobacteriota bacterium]|nr:hypothetical protein [Acidobacteriota bacterium]
MSFTLYIVFHGLVALFPNTDGSRTVLLPDALSADFCEAHRVVLKVQEGQCQPDCTQESMQGVMIDLGLPPLPSGQKLVDFSQAPDLWPLSSDLNRSPMPSNAPAAQLLVEGGSVTQCDIHTIKLDALVLTPTYRLHYPKIVPPAPVGMREAFLVESLLWKRTNIEQSALSMSVTKGSQTDTFEITPSQCNGSERCIVLEIANFGVNTSDPSCFEVSALAKHFQHYFPLLGLGTGFFPSISNFPSALPRRPGCTFSPSITSYEPLTFAPLWPQLFGGVITPRHRAACPIVQ